MKKFIGFALLALCLAPLTSLAQADYKNEELIEAEKLIAFLDQKSLDKILDELIPLMKSDFEKPLLPKLITSSNK